MTEVLRAIGLMSGTSMDGVDVACIETDGEEIASLGPTGSRRYAAQEREILSAAAAAALAITDRTDRSGIFGEAERVVTRAHRQAVESFLAENAIARDSVDVIGFHGQTIMHRPDQRLTVQIGDGQALAAELGIDVVYDLRAADVAAGGQGAPFVPAYHKALVKRAELELPVAVLNLGGVGNVTWIDEGDPVAFDTGPGNALIDDWVSAQTGAAFDEGGRLAASGVVDDKALERLLDNAYFARTPPKSLDRNDFSLAPIESLSLEDGAATLAAFTASTAALAARWFPAPVHRWIVVGGGAHNPAILDMLAHRLDASVMTGADVGWSGDHVEAQAFAYLAVRSRRGLPLTYPTTTGVTRPLSGGVFAPGR